MAKKILVLGLCLFLITSLSVMGTKKSKDKKMLDLLEKMENASYPNENMISKYLVSPEPDVFYPASDDTVGYTYYDYQHNDTQRRQIANGPDGTLHFTWMNLIGPDMTYSRYVDYNSFKTGWLNPGGVHVTPAIVRAGYCGLDLLPDSREVLFYHHTQPTIPGDWGTVISIEMTTPGFGELNTFDIPDSFTYTTNKGQWPCMAISKKMVADTMFMHITHAEGQSGSSDKRKGYVRCFEKPSNPDTLVCESPGWGTPFLIPKDTRLTPNKITYTFTTARLGGTAVATSPVSQKVAIIWLQNTPLSQTQNEVTYIESINNGDDWIASGTMTPVQITDYAAGGYAYSAIWDLAAAYDYNDELHIVWTTYRDSYFKDVSLWHWSSSTGIVKVSSVETSSTMNPGTYNLIISKFTLGVGYNPLDSAYNYLYLTYTKFKNGDKSAGGYSNGDIYVQVSSNGGLTWGSEINLTNTNSNGCLTGDCESEHWSSIAEKVDSFLYIQYIYDLDAGGVSLDEGTFTFNPVRHLKYPLFLIQPIAKLSFSPDQMVTPIRWATNGGTFADSLVVRNESGTATLYVKLSGPSWLNISPANFSIAEAGPPQIVNLTFNGAGLNDTLLVDSLQILSNNGLIGGGETYSDTKWVKIHFAVTDSFYHAEYDTIDNDVISITVSNVGNLGNEEEGQQMFYNGHDYLFDFSPVICTNIPGYGNASASWFRHRNDFLPGSSLELIHCPGLHCTVVKSKFAPICPSFTPPYHWFWWWYTIEEKMLFFWKPKDPHYGPAYDRAIVKYTKLYKNPPPPWWCNIESEPPNLPSIYLGLIADWDVPSEAYLRNIGGYDQSKNLIWLTSDSAGFENYYGACQFFYATKDGDTSWTPFGAHILDDTSFLTNFPSSESFDDTLFKYLSTPGWSIESDSAKDKSILISAIHSDNPLPTTEVTMKYALMVTDQGYTDLEELADGLRQIKCADCNADGDVSISDVITILNYLFKGGPQPWDYYCDYNGDCNISVSDLVGLICYLFRFGPPPECNCPECDP